MSEEQVSLAVSPEPPFDPAAWGEDFERWALTNCVFRDRCFGGIAALHTAFCEWTIAHDSVPVRRAGFEALLAREGFLFADGMVYGLLLKVDWESAANWPQSGANTDTESEPVAALDDHAQEQAEAKRQIARAWDKRMRGAA